MLRVTKCLQLNNKKKLRLQIKCMHKGVEGTEFKTTEITFIANGCIAAQWSHKVTT